MSRRKTFPSLSSSRQMMMAWKVSGLSHRPAIMASRPASMRLAMAISPSRESSSTEPISRRYMRTGSSVRSVGSLVSALAGSFGCTSTSSPPSLSASSSGSSRGAFFLGLGFLVLDDVDAHLAEHRQHVLDLLGVDLLRGQTALICSYGDVAALLGARISFLTAASERSSSGLSGGISELSSFGTFSFCGVALVVLAMIFSTVR